MERLRQRLSPISMSRPITEPSPFHGQFRRDPPRVAPIHPAELLARRTFNTEAVSGQVGGLLPPVDRKRGGMTVRVLMENYGDLITQVMPCTLMSPDSVARFFLAVGELFDIVVFDEVSQIRVADAIGAMGRAKSVVVVGTVSRCRPPALPRPVRLLTRTRTTTLTWWSTKSRF